MQKRSLRLVALLAALFLAPAARAQDDTDGDGVLDPDDNCVEVPNAPPADCDSDHGFPGPSGLPCAGTVPCPPEP